MQSTLSLPVLGPSDLVLWKLEPGILGPAYLGGVAWGKFFTSEPQFFQLGKKTVWGDWEDSIGGAWKGAPCSYLLVAVWRGGPVPFLWGGDILLSHHRLPSSSSSQTLWLHHGRPRHFSQGHLPLSYFCVILDSDDFPNTVTVSSAVVASLPCFSQDPYHSRTLSFPGVTCSTSES